MGDEHILSQDELDALLGGDGAGTGSSVDGHTLGETFRLVLQAASDALGNLCGADLFMEIEGTPDLGGQLPTDEVSYLVTYQLTGGMDGELSIVLGETVTQAMVACLNEEPVAGREQVAEVLAEAMNVVGSSFSETLSSIVSSEVTVRVQAVRWIEPHSELNVLTEADPVLFEVAVDFGDLERSIGYLIVPEVVAESCLGLLTQAAGIETESMVGQAEPRRLEPLASAPKGYSAPTPSPRASSVRPADFAPLGGAKATGGGGNLDLLLDVPLRLTVELGRTEMQIREILGLSKGQVIELDKLAGEPVDVFVNNKLIAKGEVVVMDEHFGVKITNIISRMERMQNVQ